MAKSCDKAALKRLVASLGSVERLRQVLEQTGSQKEKLKLINFHLEGHNGRTVVHLAAFWGLEESLLLLLKSGGNPNVVSSPADCKQTPLHLAASKGHHQCIQILLEHKANVDMKNTRMQTAYNLSKSDKCVKVFKEHKRTKHQRERATTGNISRQKFVSNLEPEATAKASLPSGSCHSSSHPDGDEEISLERAKSLDRKPSTHVVEMPLNATEGSTLVAPPSSEIQEKDLTQMDKTSTAAASKPIADMPPPSVEVKSSISPPPPQDCNRPALESPSPANPEVPTACVSPYTPPPEVRDMRDTKHSTGIALNNGSNSVLETPLPKHDHATSSKIGVCSLPPDVPTSVHTQNSLGSPGSHMSQSTSDDTKPCHQVAKSSIIITAGRPKRSQLNYLDTGHKKLRLTQRVGVNWKNLAYVLAIPDHVVNNIEHDTRHSGCQDACDRVFCKWLDGYSEVKRPITWGRLIEALEDAELGELAMELQDLTVA